MALVFDIETVAIQNDDISTVDKVHCIVTLDPDTKEFNTYHNNDTLPRNGTVEDGIKSLSEATTIICHNAIGFDAPVLGRLYGFKHDNLHDTFIISQLLFNKVTYDGKHGLASWGMYFGVPKPEHEDWSRLTTDMLHRCKEDVKITARLWKMALPYLKSPEYDIREALYLEYEVYKAYVHNNRPWAFDRDAAVKGQEELRKQLDELVPELQNALPLVVKPGKEIKNVWKKSIDLSKPLSHNMWANTYKYLVNAGVDPHTVAGEFCSIEIRPVNLSSSKEKVEALLQLGWRPDSLTPAGNPKLSKSEFLGIGTELKEKLQTFNKLDHCLSTIKGFLEREVDGAIRGYCLTCGTNTGRYQHSGIANLPRVGSTGGELLRGCFTVPSEDYVLIGCDAASIENRIEGHATWDYDNGTYARFLLETEDIHQYNADIWGVDRTTAKSPAYALNYNCGGKKVAQLLNMPEHEGERLKELYFEGPRQSSKALNDDISKFVQDRWGQSPDFDRDRPYIIGIDGRPIFVRSVHSCKNAYIQNAATVVMKVAYVWLHKKIIEEGLDAWIQIFYHDEFQVISHKSVAERVRELCEQSIVKAGEVFKLKVPMLGESEIGSSWACTH